MSAYDGAIRLVSSRNPKAAKIAEGRRQSVSLLKKGLKAEDRPIWFHAASLGEFEQARPLIEKMKAENPECKIVVSFFSPSGYEVRKNYPLADVVCYLPADTPRKVSEFIETMRPSVAFFVKYEFWGNALEVLHRSGIPTYLICGVFRPDQLFFKPWGGFYRRLLRWFEHLFVQDEESRKLLEGIGIKNVSVAGDTRFDRVSAIREAARRIPEAENFCKSTRENGGMVMVAGSSWEPDEEVYSEWIARHPEVKLILAPHEFDERRIMLLKGRFGAEKCIALSESQEHPEKLESAQVLIIDCFGLLSSLYAYGDVAYVGGGFGVSIHNINEAAVYGIPVMFGPNNHKFIEAQELKANGGGIEIRDKKEFETKADSLLKDREERSRRGKKAGAYIEFKLGATDKILLKIKALHPQG